MSEIDLKPFCGTDVFRPYLHEPFQVGDFTYATNGHILVLVPRREGSSPLEADITLNPERPFKGRETLSFAPPAPHVLPPEPMVGECECTACDGRGREHDCPDCTCECDGCGGKGKVSCAPDVSTKVHGVHFNLRYIRMVLALPGVELATSMPAGDDPGPLHFKFDGGIGLLMPMRRAYAYHCEIFKTAEAAA